jgi:hypothetical protein
MAKTKQRGLDFDIQVLVDTLGLDKVIEQIGKKDDLQQMDVRDILEDLAPAKRPELLRLSSSETKS